MSRSAHLRARHCSLLFANSVKPLGLLIRNNCALMFGPLACGVYLWAVCEDAHAYLCMHIHMISVLAFSPASEQGDTNTQLPAGLEKVPRC